MGLQRDRARREDRRLGADPCRASAAEGSAPPRMRLARGNLTPRSVYEIAPTAIRVPDERCSHSLSGEVGERTMAIEEVDATRRERRQASAAAIAPDFEPMVPTAAARRRHCQDEQPGATAMRRFRRDKVACGGCSADRLPPAAAVRQRPAERARSGRPRQRAVMLISPALPGSRRARSRSRTRPIAATAWPCDRREGRAEAAPTQSTATALWSRRSTARRARRPARSRHRADPNVEVSGAFRAI